MDSVVRVGRKKIAEYTKMFTLLFPEPFSLDRRALPDNMRQVYFWYQKRLALINGNPFPLKLNEFKSMIIEYNGKIKT
jgi:hypothetical protein